MTTHRAHLPHAVRREALLLKIHAERQLLGLELHALATRLDPLAALGRTAHDTLHSLMRPPLLAGLAAALAVLLARRGPRRGLGLLLRMARLFLRGKALIHLWHSWRNRF